MFSSSRTFYIEANTRKGEKTNNFHHLSHSHTPKHTNGGARRHEFVLGAWHMKRGVWRLFCYTHALDKWP